MDVCIYLSSTVWVGGKRSHVTYCCLLLLPQVTAAVVAVDSEDGEIKSRPSLGLFFRGKFRSSDGTRRFGYASLEMSPYFFAPPYIRNSLQLRESGTHTRKVFGFEFWYLA